MGLKVRREDDSIGTESNQCQWTVAKRKSTVKSWILLHGFKADRSLVYYTNVQLTRIPLSLTFLHRSLKLCTIYQFCCRHVSLHTLKMGWMSIIMNNMKHAHQNIIVIYQLPIYAQVILNVICVTCSKSADQNVFSWWLCIYNCNW